MKVLMIINLCLGSSATLPERNLIKGLHAKGVDITIMAHWATPETKELEDSGIRLVYQPVLKKFDIPAIRKLRSLFREEKFDILHVTYSKAITNGVIASRGFNLKVIAYLGSLSLHWHDPSAYLSFLNRRVDKLICLSDGVEEHVLRQSPVRMKDKTIRIYKGYNPDWLKGVIPEERKNLNIPPEAFVVCCVANIRKIKGVDWLIKSADYLPPDLPVWFILVGHNSDSGRVKRMIQRTGYRDRFITIGYTKNPLAYTALCDLYIQPSLSEGLGRSVIEAMCLRKPVVVTNVGGAQELVAEGINGYVVPVRSAKAIGEIISRCYGNREKMSSMGEAARNTILNDFNPQTTVDRTYDLYTELLSEAKQDKG